MIVLCSLLNGRDKEEIPLISCTNYSVLLRYIPFASLTFKASLFIDAQSALLLIPDLIASTTPSPFYTG